MRLAVLIGASRHINSSPIIPLPLGRYRFETMNLIDTIFKVDGTDLVVKDGLIINGPMDLVIKSEKAGTETGLINIFLKRESNGNDITANS